MNEQIQQAAPPKAIVISVYLHGLAMALGVLSAVNPTPGGVFLFLTVGMASFATALMLFGIVMWRSLTRRGVF